MISDWQGVVGSRTAPEAVVVVGAGPAGLALARRLAAHGRDVVLVESGDDVSVGAVGGPRSEDLNTGVVTGLPYPGLGQGRTRVIGGAGQLWHGQCMRLQPLDLERRDWVAHSGWPLDLAELDRFYPEAERWLGVSGRGYDAERWREHPGLAPLAWDDRRLLHDFTEYAPRPMLGVEHRRALVDDPRIQVFVNSTVTRVLTGPTGVAGVEVAGPDGSRACITSRTVVLSGGAIENARLLQLSDPAGVGIGDGRDHVGRFLQDHPVVTTAEVRTTDFRVLQDRYLALHRGPRKLYPKVRLAPSAQRGHRLVNATAVFVHEHERPEGDAVRRVLEAVRTRRVRRGLGRDLAHSLTAVGPVARDAYRRAIRGLATGARPTRVSLQVWLEQEPDPDSRTGLATETDALGLRRAEVHWRVGEREIETSRVMTRWIGADLARLGVAEVLESEAMHDDDAWRRTVRDAYHPAGTTRMSSSPADGVVDADLEVHGVRGLYVVGSSVFPVCGYANPTLTIVALALRLGERLAKAGSDR